MQTTGGWSAQGGWSADTSDRAWQMTVGYGLNMNGNVTRHTE